MVDYNRLAATAKRLIDKNGRTLVLRKHVDGAPADPDKPWRVGAPTTSDVTVKGVFLEYSIEDISSQSGGRQQGELIKQGDMKVLVASLGLTEPITDKFTLIKGTEVWTIINPNPLEPADVPLLYSLQVRRGG